MRYITPGLLVRFGSPNDGVASLASKEWEAAHDAYLSHLAAIRPELPRQLQRLLKRFYLHDAKVRTITLDEAPYFSLILELERPARPADRFLELRYRLIGPKGAQFKAHPELAGDGKALGWWQYDEVDVHGTPEGVTLFTHSILFTGGYELELRFFGFSCRRLPFFSTTREDDVPQLLNGLLAG